MIIVFLFNPQLMLECISIWQMRWILLFDFDQNQKFFKSSFSILDITGMEW
jgi:hypothetical protein